VVDGASRQVQVTSRKNNLASYKTQILHSLYPETEKVRSLPTIATLVASWARLRKITQTGITKFISCQCYKTFPFSENALVRQLEDLFFLEVF
jgi:hypothetical protein